MFATDHAPHPARTKSVGFARSANGIIALEAAAAITYAVMVEEEGMDVSAWARAWHEMPLSLLPVALSSSVTGKTILETGVSQKIDVASFSSLSRNCPYDAMNFGVKISSSF